MMPRLRTSGAADWLAPVANKRYTSKSGVAAMFVRQGGQCGRVGCGIRLTSIPKKNWLVEHLQPLALGGTDDLANKALYCIPCAKAKTFHKRSKATGLTSDNYEISKAGRMESVRMGTKAEKPKRAWPKRKMASRPWPAKP